MDEVRIRYKRKIILEAYDELKLLKANGYTKKEAIDTIHEQYGIKVSRLYSWFNEKWYPYGRRGKIRICNELFYVLGALLGDGCMYNYRITNNFIILVGDEEFATKYAEKLTICTGRIAKAYIDRSKNIWFVRTN